MFDKNGMIIIPNARVSFPHLFTKPVINGSEGKYGLKLMLDPEDHADVIQALQERSEVLRKEKCDGAKVPADKRCLRDGDDLERPEYEGHMILSASTARPPVVFDMRNNKVTQEEDCSIYSGCYVNAKVRLWGQNNQYGKRINGTLIAVQFAADGEPLDGNYVPQEVAAAGFAPVEASDDFLNPGA